MITPDSPPDPVMYQALSDTGTVARTSWRACTSKLYLEEFPEKIRSRSLVTRDPEAIERFVGKVGRSVVKPLYGGRGRNVFMIEDETEANLAQMTEAVLQDGYAIVQEFVDGGEDGDARIFLLEGKILECDGKLAAFRRVPTGNDLRANISVGGRSVPLEIGDVERGIIDAMSEKLVADGMFFVGIDVIGDKVVEINAESTGGMQSVEWLYEIDVCPTVIEALERRTGSKSWSRSGVRKAVITEGAEFFGRSSARSRPSLKTDRRPPCSTLS
jgi:glutathione synthase